MFSYGPPDMAKQKQGDQLEPTYSSSVRIQDVVLRTCQKRWTIGRSGERGLGIFVLVARHDYDDTIQSSNWLLITISLWGITSREPLPPPPICINQYLLPFVFSNQTLSVQILDKYYFYSAYFAMNVCCFFVVQKYLMDGRENKNNNSFLFFFFPF